MDAFLANTSIIFIVEVNNPVLFTSNYLVDIGVIPHDARIEGAVTVPVVSQIAYNDGYRFEASEGRIALFRDYPPLTSDQSGRIFAVSDLTLDDSIDGLQELANNLVDPIKPFLLESVGINFRLFVMHSDLGQFVASFRNMR